ncbi:myosin binding protein Ca isoform X1 [Hemiscyllium ocellatum]|uniref:myosin binding protein Ca isoform X1 n=1 Tax=Hemiscyllium ocellatum TaxID=170820 RepID=UPI0029663006|nr:myosin binding protein Ca isoform X1 [Hemiscyllium ocellatum]XP_060705632.1 myosin binding protein Ca isoform X1 [Hemiscyllium ocellatum]
MPEPKKPAGFTKKPQSQTGTVGGKVEFVVEVDKPNVKVKWQKDGKDLIAGPKYTIKAEGKKHTLTINHLAKQDDSVYIAVVGTVKEKFELQIKEAEKSAEPETAAATKAPAEEQSRSELPEDDTAPADAHQNLTGLFIEKPETTSALIGSSLCLVAKVDSSNLQKKPTIKWFKGKWMDLSSKAGKVYQFKEQYDSKSKIYTYEMKIAKVDKTIAGGYRCEVTSKDQFDSVAFDITVEASVEESNLLTTFKRTAAAGEDAGELDFSGLLKKREVKVQETPKEEVDVWEILKNAKPCDYEKIAFQYGITDLRGMLKRLKKKKRVEKKSEAFAKRLESAYQVDKGGKIRMAIELAGHNMDVKWLKNGKEIRPSARFIFEVIGLKRVLTIKNCILADDAEYECIVGDDKCVADLFVREPPVVITVPLDDQHVFVDDRVEFDCEVSEEGAVVVWTKNGVELTREDSLKYRIKKSGKKHMLIINDASKEDAGRYKIATNGGESEADLIVEDKVLEVLQSFADLTLKAQEQAVFKCEVSDEKVTGKWLKNGIEVKPSKRIHITHKGRFHKLVIDDITPDDEADYTFIPDGYALSISAKLNFLEIKIDYVPRQEPPKIHLDCTGSVVSQNTIVVVAGNKVRLDADASGEPPPTITWYKTDQVLTDVEGRLRIETKNNISSLVLEGALREDEAKYSILVQNPAGEDKATIFIKVVDVPDPPENVKIIGIGEDWCTAGWDIPKYDGGQPITGYLLERKKKTSMRWMKLNFEPLQETTFTATRMIEGCLYEMRVFAVNGIGISQPSASSRTFMPLAVPGEPSHLCVEDVTDTTTTLKWRMPEKIGAGGVDGYLIEYCKEGSNEWIAANTELVERLGFTVKNLPTGEKINFRVRAVNIAGKSEPAILSQSVTIREIVQHPKIWVPRQLRHTFIRRVGQQINLVIPFQGKPRPVVTWLKDGQPLDTKQVSTRNSEVDTILFIRSAERSHSGKYELSVQIENLIDKATIKIQVVDKPGPPESLKIVDVWGFNASIEWTPPKDTGNTEITGYTIQKADKKTMEWFTVYEHNRKPHCTISDLIMGNEYYFRVFSENICGLSDSPRTSKNTAYIQKDSKIYNPSPFKEHDFSHAPKFTQPLLDRSIIAGYTAKLSCSVRGCPKPKIIWMKNKMAIIDDPKFLMHHNQGVLTLQIRKPSSFDGGMYTCKAINDLGEDEVECKLEVRVPQ